MIEKLGKSLKTTKEEGQNPPPINRDLFREVGKLKICQGISLNDNLTVINEPLTSRLRAVFVMNKGYGDRKYDNNRNRGGNFRGAPYNNRIDRFAGMNDDSD